jgi:hypothetical protein
VSNPRQRLEASLDYETTVLFRHIAAAAVRVELRGSGAVALRKPKPGLLARLFASDDGDAAAPAITLTPEQLAVRARGQKTYEQRNRVLDTPLFCQYR